LPSEPRYAFRYFLSCNSTDGRLVASCKSC
jgi:hypothetical protein